MRDTANCQRYAFINRHIKDVSQVQDGAVIQALIKNYQEYGVYCSLNVGVSGIVQEDQSVKQLRQYFDIGDIIQVQVDGQRRSGHLRLRFQGPQNPSMFIPPNGFKPNNVKASDYTFGPVQNQQQQQQQLMQSQMSQYQRHQYQNNLGYSQSLPTTGTSMSMQSPLYCYQQNANMYQNNKKSQKSMNVQSPAFVPNTSFSGSSNGDNTLNNTYNSDWAQYNIGSGNANHSNSSSFIGTSKNQSPQVQQDIPFSLGFSQSQDQMKPQLQQNMVLGMSQSAQVQNSKHMFQSQKSLNPEKKINQFLPVQYFRPPSSNEFVPTSSIYHEDFNKSSSFVVSSSQNANGQRYFQMKTTQEEFSYKPNKIQPRDETQSIAYGLTQGSQGGQLQELVQQNFQAKFKRFSHRQYQ